jgi:uncharacterized membrane protein YidH (DUF202 family)
MSVDGPVHPSAYVERTALAWRRTGLTLLAVALGGAKVAQVVQTWFAVLLAAATALAALGVVARAEQLLLRDDPTIGSRAQLMSVVCCATMVLAVGGVVLALA